MIPYNGATIAFTIAILAAFGIKAIRFEKSVKGAKVCKLKVNGLHITEAELLSIVHKVELVFHLTQHRDNYLKADIHEFDATDADLLPTE